MWRKKNKKKSSHCPPWGSFKSLVERTCMTICIHFHFKVYWYVFSGPFNPNQFAAKLLWLFLPANPLSKTLAYSNKPASRAIWNVFIHLLNATLWYLNKINNIFFSAWKNAVFEKMEVRSTGRTTVHLLKTGRERWWCVDGTVPSHEWLLETQPFHSLRQKHQKWTELNYNSVKLVVVHEVKSGLCGKCGQ